MRLRGIVQISGVHLDVEGIDHFGQPILVLIDHATVIHSPNVVQDHLLKQGLLPFRVSPLYDPLGLGVDAIVSPQHFGQDLFVKA